MSFVAVCSCDNRFTCDAGFENNFIVEIKDTVFNGLEMVEIPRGPYRSGLNAEWDTIPYDFMIGKYEITNRQFHSFVKNALKAGMLVLEDEQLRYYFSGHEFIPDDWYHVKVWDDRIYLENGEVILNEAFAEHPVISTTWFGCLAFCRYFGFDLPTAAEWEKAARGPFTFWFPWGNAIDGSYANYYQSGDPFEPGTTPVGFYDGQQHSGFQTSDARSVFGCYDMAGNAWEWTRDIWSAEVPYFKGKGGGFHYHTPAFLQVYYVSTFGPGSPPVLDMCDVPDGFRVVYR